MSAFRLVGQRETFCEAKLVLMQCKDISLLRYIIRSASRAER